MFSINAILTLFPVCYGTSKADIICPSNYIDDRNTQLKNQNRA